jgi:hypothetical protein
MTCNTVGQDKVARLCRMTCTENDSLVRRFVGDNIRTALLVTHVDCDGNRSSHIALGTFCGIDDESFFVKLDDPSDDPFEPEKWRFPVLYVTSTTCDLGLPANETFRKCLLANS